jgi:solute carrier family 32 (vesicular inhibitory amino acid transporter)
MDSGKGQTPASWAPGGRLDSSESTPSVTWDPWDPDTQRHRQSEQGHLHPEDAEYAEAQQHLRRRRSSLADRVHALRSAGGANSFDNFARSWQRAAGFYEVVPVRHSFRVTESDEEDGQDYQRGSVDSPMAQRSLLREQLESGEGRTSDEALEEAEDDLETPRPLAREQSRDYIGREQSPLLGERASRLRGDSILAIEPQLASPFGGSYGSTWSSLSARVNEPSMRHAGRLFRQQQMTGTSEPDKEREPLLVKQIQEEDGKVVNVVVGQSTLPQTIFNSVNVLVGVGLLALPLAMRYAGWVAGLVFLTFSALSTSYTAKLLAKCADVDNSIITFADLAYVSFGYSARLVTSILFTVELLGACVALVVLFADSLDALIPGWGLTEWKIVCGFILIPLGFVPLRLLSFTSILGILCCFGIVLAVFVDGLIKPHQPGSLREPATTYLFPANWATLPISFGLLMSPWGGHSVFPNIYRDMRHPYKYRKGVNITYIFTFLLDVLMAVVGLLMFGDGVKDEITKNIVVTKGYPEWLSIFIVICIAIIPLTKVPLNARPIVSTLELSLGLDARAMADAQALTGLSGFTRGILKFTVRITCTIIFVILAILVPDFDRIMSLIGSVACFTICIVLPCSFHLKLFGKELEKSQKMLDWTLIIVSSVLAIISTAFNFIPREKLGF